MRAHTASPGSLSFWTIGLLSAASCNGCENYGDDAETTAVYEGGADEAGTSESGTAGEAETSGETGFGTTGVDEPTECAPFSTDKIGQRYVCEGWGVGAAEFDISGTSNSPFRCVSNPDQTNIDDCVDNPILFPDIATASAGLLQNPGACCSEVDLDNPDSYAIAEDACLNDCAHASCQWAVLKMRETADTLSCANPVSSECHFRTDLIAAADKLEAPAGMAECVGTVKSAPHKVVLHALGAQGGNALGDIENITLYLGCGVTNVTLEPGDAMCTDAPNAVPLPEGSLPGVDVPIAGAITFGGMAGSGHANILDHVATFTIGSDCRNRACPLELQSFDMIVDDLEIGSFTLHDIEVDLPAPIVGTLTGTSVSFAPGTFALRVAASVEMAGEYPFGVEPLEFTFTSDQVVDAEIDAAGELVIRMATFEQAGVTAVLSTASAQ